MDKRSNVYMSEYLGHNLQNLTSGCHLISKWGGMGSEERQFYGPYGLTVDEMGNIYEVDTHNDRVQKFTKDGQFIAEWGSDGSGDGQFQFYEFSFKTPMLINICQG